MDVSLRPASGRGAGGRGSPTSRCTDRWRGVRGDSAGAGRSICPGLDRAGADCRPLPPSDGHAGFKSLVSTRAIRARTCLISMVTAFSASTALGAIGATLGAQPANGTRLPGIAFAALIGGVLLSRARAHRDLAMSLPLITCGTVTLSAALVAAAMALPLQSAHFAAVSVGLAAAALCLGFVSAKISPVGQRVSELLEYLALAAVLPLACWICGIYAAMRGVNPREDSAVAEYSGARRRLSSPRCRTVARFPRRGIAAGDRQRRLPQPAPPRPPRPTVQREVCAVPSSFTTRTWPATANCLGLDLPAGLEAHPRLGPTRRRHRHRSSTTSAAAPHRGRR